MTVLIVDDDKELCAMMVEYLSAHAYSVDCTHDGASGLARAYERPYDIIILDVMLPRLHGFDVLRSLRRRSDVPVILLTARAGESDRLQGFEVGADDYLPKPFAASELLARIRAVLRRARGARQLCRGGEGEGRSPGSENGPYANFAARLISSIVFGATVTPVRP